LAPSEAIQPKANIAGQQLAISRNKADIASYYQNLLVVLGLDPAAKLEVDTKESSVIEPLPTLEQSIAMGLANNTLYQEALLEHKKNERELLKAKDNKKWQLNAIGTINQPIGGVTNQGSNKSLVLKLDIPIQDREKQKQLLNAKALLQKSNIDKEQIKNK